jgi:hypothetical protein
MEMYVAIIVLLLIIFLFLLTRENFDVYYNHSAATADVLDTSIPKAELWAKYNWNNRDPNGTSIYDDVYTKMIYDSSTAPKYRDNSYNCFDYVNFADPDPKFTIFNGEKIYLSQKNY